MTEKQIPTYEDLLWPTLNALKARGGSASIQELSEQIASDLGLPDSILDALYKGGTSSVLDYHARWTRTHLKYIGAVENSSRGVWAITETGRKIPTEQEVRKQVLKYRQENFSSSDKRRKGVRRTKTEKEDEQIWREELLDNILKIKPEAFERLCQRILREAGFIKVEITGRSGDGGIDGVGVLRVNLLSFHVAFQCKRYSGSVGAEEIRNFRGSIIGRADKGLFITTGNFTRDAQREAVRDSASAIDLIDGIYLCDLLKNFSVGVTTESVEIVRPQREFFENF